MSPRRRWLALQLATGTGLVAVFVRYLGGYRLTTPAGKIWGVADDVYVSACFARTLSEGEGLLWYPAAPRVEGFSNPLWVMLLAALHRLPGFREDRLGFYLAVCNAVVMLLLGVVLVRCARRAAGEDHAPTLATGGVSVLLCLIACTPLCVCVSKGFETGAAALFSLLAFSEAVGRPAPLRPHRVAVFTALAFWTRMDALLLCVPALVLTAMNTAPRRRLLGPLAILTVLVAAQFLLRRWYFGDFVPNTYYLKASGWAFVARTAQGYIWSSGILLTTAIVTVPMFLVARRALGRAAIPVAAALGGFLLTVGYSINNGGDLILVFGHDRYNAAGAVFLAFALSTAVLVLARSALRGAFVAAVCLLSATGPFWFPVPVGAFWVLVDFFDPRRPALHPDTLAANWTYQGKMLRHISKPRARIAVCAAGAMIYFSRRGGVDLLGKVEPLVAHLPVPDAPPREARCWRGFPGAGHNKEDVPAVFAAHTPELSVVVPPASHRARYARIRYRGLEFFALRNSAYVEWKNVQIVD